MWYILVLLLLLEYILLIKFKFAAHDGVILLAFLSEGTQIQVMNIQTS
jgi:hypothetical protein